MHPEDHPTRRYRPLAAALADRREVEPHRGPSWARARLKEEQAVCFHRGAVTYATTSSSLCPECVTERLAR